MVRCRGIRGAITVPENTVDAIIQATRTLLMAVVDENRVEADDVASVIFTATSDLDAVYPAVVAREMGWTQTPLLCMQEMWVEGSLPRCVRVLVHWNTDRTPAEINHVDLRDAVQLRPDLTRGRV